MTLDFMLHPGGVDQTVTVDGSGASINTTDGAASTVIDRQFASNIPLNGRSFQFLLTAVPGVSVVPSTGNGESGERSTHRGQLLHSKWGSSATITLSGIAFPLTQAQIDTIPAPNTAAPYGASVYAVNPHLSSPYSLQWNAAVEQGLGRNQTFTLNYVASIGRQLYLPKQYLPYYLGNTSFSPNAYLVLTNNGSSSSYNAIQMQFNRRLAQGLQALASYTWSHSIDDATNNASVFEQLRGPSDYDIRNNFELALNYDVAGDYQNAFAAAALKHWSFVTRITARSALSIDLIGYESIGGGSGLQVTYHPNLVPGVPEYVRDSTVPSGRRINTAAFTGVMNALSTPLFAIWRASAVPQLLASYGNKPPAEKIITADTAAAAARRALPGMKVTGIIFPNPVMSTAHHFLVYTKGRTPVTSRLFTPVLVDAETGQVAMAKSFPWYIRTLEVSRPLHFGDYGGLPLKIIWALFDVAAILVLASGVYLWVSRRQTPVENELDRLVAIENQPASAPGSGLVA